jgi:hypothetical protein
MLSFGGRASIFVCHHSTMSTDLVRRFHAHGFVLVRNALPALGIQSFLADVHASLLRMTCQDPHGPGIGSLDMWQPDSWPKGRRRRVGEVSARGIDSSNGAPNEQDVHWNMLMDPAAPLAQALDELLGANCWEIPLNGQRECLNEHQSEVGHTPYPPPSWNGVPRYIYCPVAMSEFDGFDVEAVRSQRASSLAPEIPSDSKCSGRRIAMLCSAFDEPFQATLEQAKQSAGPEGSAPFAAATWQPINRRRYLNKGWHLDVGPGFPNDGIRTLRGDPRQGVVMLLLLTDCAPGAGGTAMVAGSHDWMIRRLARAQRNISAAPDSTALPVTHEAINSESVKIMRRLTEAGRVSLPCAAACSQCFREFSNCVIDESTSTATQCELTAEDIELGIPSTVRVDQIIGRAGDMVLMHPLLIHSGTSNCAVLPRVLVNGIARLKPNTVSPIGCTYGDAAQYQCPLLARDLERLGIAAV